MELGRLCCNQKITSDSSIAHTELLPDNIIWESEKGRVTEWRALREDKSHTQWERVVLFLSPYLLSFAGVLTTVSTTDFSYGPWTDQLISLSIKCLPDSEGYRQLRCSSDSLIMQVSLPSHRPCQKKSSGEQMMKGWRQKASQINKCLDWNIVCV